ncbi:MAG: T9SS type A sorting domain-containing protein [Bacteroidota bacterium]
MKNINSFFFLFLVPFIYSYAQDYTAVSYGPEDRQYLDIYIAPSDCPTPVYFDAHGNGGTTNMPNSIVDSLKANGISIVAWESLTSVNTPDQVQTGWDDAVLMFDWVIANADTYNFDTTNFIIGGSSRGSILSWKYGHHPNPNIKGLYMYNALPNGVWADATWWYPPSEVNSSSPPIFFVYRYEPGVSFDSHDPLNGIKIMETYDMLGIGDRDTLIHSIAYTDNTDKYQFLLEFIRSVTTPCTITSTSDVEVPLPNWKVFPNPFNDRFEIAGLTGTEQILLTTLDGRQIKMVEDLNTFNLTGWSPGIYFVKIQSQNHSRVFKLIKN